MPNVKVHISISDDLLKDIDRIVGKRKRSEFFNKAAQEVVKRVKLQKALEKAEGAWCDDKHPELVKGTDRWLRNIRVQSEERITRITEHLDD